MSIKTVELLCWGGVRPALIVSKSTTRVFASLITVSLCKRESASNAMMATQ